MPECLEMAKKYDVTVLGTKDTTSYIVSSLITYLKSELAPRVTRHGVLVEIYGEGILINGDSAIRSQALYRAARHRRYQRRQAVRHGRGQGKLQY